MQAADLRTCDDPAECDWIRMSEGDERERQLDCENGTRAGEGADRAVIMPPDRTAIVRENSKLPR